VVEFGLFLLKNNYSEIVLRDILTKQNWDKVETTKVAKVGR